MCSLTPCRTDICGLLIQHSSSQSWTASGLHKGAQAKMSDDNAGSLKPAKSYAGDKSTARL